MDNEPNKGIGQYIIVAILAFVDGCFKFGFEWYGLKAILFAMGISMIFGIGAIILEVIIDKFKD
jgi:hypothetical protein